MCRLRSVSDEHTYITYLSSDVVEEAAPGVPEVARGVAVPRRLRHVLPRVQFEQRLRQHVTESKSVDSQIMLSKILFLPVAKRRRSISDGHNSK